MNFSIKTIPHYAQRYDTVGDYWFKHLMQIEIRISDFSPVTAETNLPVKVDEDDVTLAEKYEFLVGLHEFIEAFLCYQAKIEFKDIDKFDMEHLDSDEPGNEADCPYRTQHKVATAIEQEMATFLGVDWTDYENAVQKLSKQAAERKEQEKEPTT